jgi:hypothetical protein
MENDNEGDPENDCLPIGQAGGFDMCRTERRRQRGVQSQMSPTTKLTAYAYSNTSGPEAVRRWPQLARAAGFARPLAGPLGEEAVSHQAR